MKLNVKALLNDTHQLTRITILAGVVLVLAIASFAGYYYYDRYYTSQVPVAQKTIAEVEQTVRDNPQDTEARLILAQTYMVTGRFDDAITQALQVQKKLPDEVRANYVLGVAYANSGKPKEAIEPLTKFVMARQDEEMPATDKQLQSAFYYLGDSFLQLGQPEQALQPLANAVGYSKTDADAMYKLGLAYLGTKDYTNAVNMFSEATRFVPDFSEAYDAMARAYDESKQPELAKYARGMLAYSRKDYPGALALLLPVAQSQSGFAPVFIGLGLTYEGMSDLQNAKSSYQAAVLLDPQSFTANNGLQRVEAGLKK